MFCHDLCELGLERSEMDSKLTLRQASILSVEWDKMRNESISIVWHEGLQRLVVDVLRRRIRSTQTTGTGTTYWTGRRRTSSSAAKNLAFLDYHTIHDASRMSVHDAYIAYGTPELWLLKSKQKRKRKTVGRT